MHRIVFILLFIFSYLSSLSQDKKEPKWKEKVDFSGFVKYMNTSSILDLDSIITDNLLHNRLRLKVNFNDKLTSVIEVRNRVFYGEATRLNPYLGQMLDVDMGQVDLSFVSLDRKSVVMHSILDRAYLKYSAGLIV